MPVPIWFTPPLPLMTLLTVTLPLKLKARVPLSTTLPVPSWPPLLISSVPVVIVVRPE